MIQEFLLTDTVPFDLIETERVEPQIRFVTILKIVLLMKEEISLSNFLSQKQNQIQLESFTNLQGF